MKTAGGHALRTQPVALAQHHGEHRHGDTRSDHEHPAHMAHDAGLLGLRADHEARGVAQRDDRQIEGITQLPEPGGLVAGRRVDRAAQVHRVVGDQAHRPALDANQCSQDADPEVRPQLQHRPGVGELLDDGAHVIDPQPILRDGVAQQALIAAAPVLDRALEIGQVPARHLGGLLLVIDQHIDHAIGLLHADRADLIGSIHAQPAAFDHRRTTHADRGILRGDDHIAATKQGRIAGKTVA